MITRDELSRFLAETYDYDKYEDYCENGLQVEGKQEIKRIAFGVSFNLPFLEKAIESKADAVIVHHGIFQEGVFKLKGHLKEKVRRLLEHQISLFGIHLPMDVHPEIGHNALLLSYTGAGDIQPFELGYCGNNVKQYTIDQLSDLFHRELHPEGFTDTGETGDNRVFSLTRKHGFSILKNGPAVPRKLAVISGGSTGFYENAIEEGIDTFVSGEIREKILSLSLETGTNYINLGHYYSEKPGVLALKKLLEDKFKIQTHYIEIENPF